MKKVNFIFIFFSLKSCCKNTCINIKVNEIPCHSINYAWYNEIKFKAKFEK